MPAHADREPGIARPTMKAAGFAAIEERGRTWSEDCLPATVAGEDRRPAAVEQQAKIIARPGGDFMSGSGHAVDRALELPERHAPKVRELAMHRERLTHRTGEIEHAVARDIEIAPQRKAGPIVERRRQLLRRENDLVNRLGMPEVRFSHAVPPRALCGVQHSRSQPHAEAES